MAKKTEEQKAADKARKELDKRAKKVGLPAGTDEAAIIEAEKVAANNIEDDTEGLIASGLDGKHRAVTLSSDGKKFKVEKLQLNAPVSELFKSEDDARGRYNELLEDTNN